MATGVLDPEQWELCFVGKDTPRLRFAGAVQPRYYQNLSWQHYAALVRESDLGLCLMYTPHRSYTPLDLAASGAVVVTNQCGPYKQSLKQYSKNIICTAPSVAALVQGLAQGVALAKDTEQRRQNYQDNRLLRDWRTSFATVLDTCARKLGQAESMAGSQVAEHQVAEYQVAEHQMPQPDAPQSRTPAIPAGPGGEDPQQPRTACPKRRSTRAGR